MKSKNLLNLLVAAVLLGVWAFLSLRQQAIPHIRSTDTYLLPGLPLNDIEKLVIVSAGGTVTLARTDAGWVSRDRYDYPADFNKIKSLLVRLAELKIGQTVAASEKHRAELKMISPRHPETAPVPENAGILVELYAAQATPLASLLIGATHQRAVEGGAGAYPGYPDGQYVSNDGGKTVCLVSIPLNDVFTGVREWLSSDLLNVPAADVIRLTLATPEKEPVVLSIQNKDKGLEVEGLSRKEETDSSKVYGVQSALSYFRLDDIADPALTDKEMGFDNPAVFAAETKTGEVYTVSIGGSPTGLSDRYVRLDVALKMQDDKSGDVSPEAVQARKEQEARIAALRQKLNARTFVVASHKVESMTLTRDQLVKKK